MYFLMQKEAKEEMEEEPHEDSFTSKSGPTFEASLYEPSFSVEKSESPREKLNEFLALGILVQSAILWINPG